MPVFNKIKGPIYMKMHNGHLVDILNPDFNMEEVAFGLSRIPRFAGQTTQEYSVASHSVLVASLSKFLGGNPKEGLLHDAPEYLTNDVPSPIKELCPDLQKLDRFIYKKMALKYSLPPVQSNITHQADMVARHLEAMLLFHTGNDGFFSEPGIKEIALSARKEGIYPKILSKLEAYKTFLIWWKRCERNEI